jgi:hypothetical protein
LAFGGVEGRPVTNELLTQTHAAIASEQCGRFDRSTDLVRQLVAEYGEGNLAERLYENIPTTCPWEVVADLFGLLIWNTSDNGSAICSWAERRLCAADDVRSIRVALGLNVYPFRQHEEMEHVLVQVAARHPEVGERCRQVIESRRRERAGRRVVRLKSSQLGFRGSDGA